MALGIFGYEYSDTVGGVLSIKIAKYGDMEVFAEFDGDARGHSEVCFRMKKKTRHSRLSCTSSI
jgi:hypothetical protein